MQLRPRHLTALAVAVGGGLTIAVSFVPSFRFAYRSPELHVAFDTAEGLIALIAAYLVFGRLRERKLTRDALLAFALLLIGSANLLLLVAPRLAAGAGSQAFAVWGSVLIRMIGSGAIAWASFSRSRAITERWTQGWRIPAAGAGALVVAVVLAYIAGKTIPLGLSRDISPVQSDPLLAGDPALLAAQLLLVMLYGAAAAGFTRAAEANESDPFLRWLAPGTTLAAFARINFSIFPSIYTDFIYVGDFLRLAFYLLLLFGASQEVRLYWRRLEADIAERRRLNAELETLSLTDPLTGLNNRRGFETLAKHAMTIASRSKTPLALVFVDLNEMKTINDVYGHDAGDEALREVATILTETSRESDVVARIGGDEFCTLMVGASGEIQKALDRVQANIDEANRKGDRPYRLSVSMGVAQWDHNAPQSVQALMQAADAEMYAEKRRRGSRPSILVVEDDPSTARVIELQLSDRFEVRNASTAAQALTSAGKDAPDLVILDYYLPDATALVVVEGLRKTLGPRVPVVILTAATDVDEAAVLRAGANDYVAKPFNPDVLEARVDRLLATSQRR